MEYISLAALARRPKHLLFRSIQAKVALLRKVREPAMKKLAKPRSIIAHVEGSAIEVIGPSPTPGLNVSR